MVPMLARIYIILSKDFPVCTSNNIKENFLVSSIFDYHKEKSPPCVRLHCVCAGRPYGSFIFQKALRVSNLNSLVCFKDQMFLFAHTSPTTDLEFIVPFLNSGCPLFPTQAV